MQDVIDTIFQLVRDVRAEASPDVRAKIVGDGDVLPGNLNDYMLGKYDGLQQALDVFRDRGYVFPDMPTVRRARR
jgi:hypothetical protein